MGYVLRLRFASFFAGAAAASAVGLYVLHHDYKAAHQSQSQQIDGFYRSLDKRISALEKLKEVEAVSKPAELTE
ncbi:uncharacterized protein LOC124946086 [Impatiens glandulifera]|uniref:uncharacterized protein LOC124946086 n=1 Tax=Impatiens glandulifera TaxID=253017 RepID=UPI001FB1710C|nr:uncharacterized protein LOC124946086 [Impatiens glandulifera]